MSFEFNSLKVKIVIKIMNRESFMEWKEALVIGSFQYHTQLHFFPQWMLLFSG